MILVDTSVLIDYFKGQINQKTDLFELVLTQDLPFGIASFTYQEILQGTKTQKDFKKLKEYLETQRIYFPHPSLHFYTEAAKLYFDLRKQGITPRSTIDMLIVQICLEKNLALLHNDRDFDYIAPHVKKLRIMENLFP